MSGGLLRLTETFRVDLLRRARNRSMLVTAFVAPLLLSLLLGTILGNLGSHRYDLAVVDADGTATSRQIVTELAGGSPLSAMTGGRTVAISSSGGKVRLRLVDSPAAARRGVDRGTVTAAVIIPHGYTASVTHSPDLVVVASPRRAVGAQIAQALATSVGERVTRVRVVLAAASANNRVVSGAELERAATAAAPVVPDTDPTGRPSSSIAYFGASMCIFFLFFTVGFAARSVLIDKERGILPRILSTPTSASTVIAGKSLSVSALGLVGFAAVWVVTTAFFGARWGDPLGVALVVVASVAAIAGVSMFVATLGRTERQADSYTTMTTFVLALIGGNFIPVGTPSSAFLRLSRFTPNGWSLRAFTDLASGRGAGAVVVPAAVLGAMAVTFGGIGLARIHRMITP